MPRRKSNPHAEHQTIRIESNKPNIHLTQTSQDHAPTDSITAYPSTLLDTLFRAKVLARYKSGLKTYAPGHGARCKNVVLRELGDGVLCTVLPQCWSRNNASLGAWLNEDASKRVWGDQFGGQADCGLSRQDSARGSGCDEAEIVTRFYAAIGLRIIRASRLPVNNIVRCGKFNTDAHC